MEQCRCSEYGTDALSSGHKGVYVNKDPSKSVMQLMDSLGGGGNSNAVLLFNTKFQSIAK